MSETHVERLKQALNIDREPFSDEGVVGLFFPGGGRQELVDQLIHLSRYGAPLLVMYGENGVGKTSVIRQVESRIDPSVFRCVHVVADVLADENLILRRVEELLHIAVGTDTESAIEVLLRYARELDGFSQTFLLVVDEAQNLSQSAIAFLCRLLSLGARSGIRCLLVVDGLEPARVPVIAPLLTDVAEVQSVEVPPLDLAAIDEYIAYRMTTSGLSDIQFSQDQKRRIQNQSLGNIDRINISARQVLVDHFPYDKNRKPAATVPRVHFLALVAASLMLVFVYWLLSDHQDDAVQVASPGSVNEPDGGVQNNSFYQPPELPLSAKTKEQASQPRLTDEKSSPPDPFSGSGGPDHESVASGTDLDSFASDADVDFNFVEQESAEDHLTPVTAEGLPIAVSDAPSSTATGMPLNEVPEQPVPVSAAKPAPVAREGMVAIQSRSEAGNLSAADELTPREKWLMSLDEAKYTLQMLGASEEESVQKFLARYPSLKEIAYYRTTHDKRDWYVVVYGVFPSKESAKQELGRLPRQLQASGPWARTLASVQKEISQRE